MLPLNKFVRDHSLDVILMRSSPNCWWSNETRHCQLAEQPKGEIIIWFFFFFFFLSQHKHCSNENFTSGPKIARENHRFTKNPISIEGILLGENSTANSDRMLFDGWILDLGIAFFDVVGETGTVKIAQGWFLNRSEMIQPELRCCFDLIARCCGCAFNCVSCWIFFFVIKKKNDII